MTSPLDRVMAAMRHPVRFLDGGAERCLTLDEAATLVRRIELAIKQAHVEIAAGPMALPICSRCGDTHEMPAWDGSGAKWMCTGCPRPCDKTSCRTDPTVPYCKNTPCACACHARDPMYERARAAARTAESNSPDQKEKFE